ncbi:hypothetical protein NPIL_634451 [Nephila pilipes]|uniref:Uncharacterized protein n=1 Tax=Nephila pilipes TaxID=299642 RepID=A0A8X6JZW2_NEPPI|nr:hypothetical protein NPIL_634451 [Nephila pilipes]
MTVSSSSTSADNVSHQCIYHPSTETRHACVGLAYGMAWQPMTTAAPSVIVTVMPGSAEWGSDQFLELFSLTCLTCFLIRSA